MATRRKLSLDAAIGKLLRAGVTLTPEQMYSLQGERVVKPSEAPPAPVPMPRTSGPRPIAHAPVEPKRAPMPTLVARVPQEILDSLDALGPDRSTALREVLARAFAAVSGTRRRVG